MPTIEQQLQRYGQYLDEVFESGDVPQAVARPERPAGRVLALAAVVVAAAVVGVLALRPDPAPTPVTTGRGTVALVPRSLPKGWGVVSTQSFTFHGYSSGAVLGPAKGAPDPRSLVVATTMAGVENLKDLLTTQVQGHPALYDASGPGSSLEWDVDPKDVVLRAGAAISEEELRAIAEGTILERDGSLTFDHLPDGWTKRFVARRHPSWPATTYAVASEGTRYDVSTFREARPGDELGIVAPVGGEVVEVRGRDGIVSLGGATLTLRWVEADGVVVSVTAQGVGMEALDRFAAGLVAADPAGWARFEALPHTSTLGPTTTMPTPVQTARLGALLDFDGDVGPLHLADGRIQLVLDDRVVASRTAAQLADRSQWQLPGGRSVLDHVGGKGIQRVGPGPLHACGAATARPRGLADATWIVAEPGFVDTCSDWWGVGVFERDGRVVAIALYEAH